MEVARREVNRAWLVHVKLCINGHLYSAVCILSRCVAMNYVQIHVHFETRKFLKSLFLICVSCYTKYSENNGYI